MHELILYVLPHKDPQGQRRQGVPSWRHSLRELPHHDGLHPLLLLPAERRDSPSGLKPFFFSFYLEAAELITLFPDFSWSSVAMPQKERGNNKNVRHLKFNIVIEIFPIYCISSLL